MRYRQAAGQIIEYRVFERIHLNILLEEIDMISVSVIMPTYNTEVSMLRYAVNSILCQTLRDFEFIIIDDGSTNVSVAYLQSLRDKRVRLIRNPINMGITKSLNIGFQAAQGKYIARMDSDDISLPTRLEKQYAFMEKHPTMIMCGTNVEFFGAFSGKSKKKINDMERYRISALFVKPAPSHPTAFFNRKLLLRYHLAYDETIVYAQDYHLWVEISRHGQIGLLKEALLLQRMHNNQISSAHRKEQIKGDQITQGELLRELLGTVTQREMDAHYHYSTGYYTGTKINDEILQWYHRLIEANDLRNVYDRKKFKYYVYNTIIKRIVYHSFEPSMSCAAMTAMFFRYMPFTIALKASLGMCARKAIIPFMRMITALIHRNN